MIALTHARFGEPAEVVAPVEQAAPAPGPGEVRLRLVRSPIHNHDLATIRGIYGYRPELPAVAGSEFLGVVDALGEGVHGLAVGTRVACMARGAWAAEIVAPIAALVPVPDGIDDDRACQLLAMPLSAVVLFDQLRTQPDMWIAQNAAAGAVGRIVMQLAQKHGVNIVNFVRREAAVEELRGYGARYVIDSWSEGWQEQARALTGGIGFARIVDSVAGSQTVELQRLLAQFGELIVFGGLSRQAIKLDPGLMIAKETVVRGFWMNAWMQRASNEERTSATRRVFELARVHELPLPVAGVYPLDEAAAALRAAETPGRAGKVLFRP
jgi:NADPH:quinone reductase-like Zn-dependent oxidoreductase